MIGDHFYTTSALERDSAIKDYGYVSEGIACRVLDKPRPPRTGDHAYTTSTAEHDALIRNEGYKDEGIACYVWPNPVTGSVPLYALYNIPMADYFYTASSLEVSSAQRQFGYIDGGIYCFVAPTQIPGSVPLFRLRSNWNGDHFYTTSSAEKNQAIAAYGYVDEGVACYVFPSSQPGTVPLLRLAKVADPYQPIPLYRLRSPGGDHFYTPSALEKASAQANFGYLDEGIAGYVFPKQPVEAGLVVLYRLYNGTTGDHFYTTSQAERTFAIQNAGYLPEATDCSVYPANWPTTLTDTVPLYRLVCQFDVAPASSTALTCDGQPVGPSTQTFAFGVQDDLSKRLYPDVISVTANSLAAAQKCAQDQVNAEIWNACVFELSQLKTFYFAVYDVPDSSGSRSCTTIKTDNLSSQDAQQALEHSTCSNCTFQDITSQVVDSSGALDLNALDNWCSNHP